MFETNHVFLTEPNQTHSEPNQSFFQKPNQNRNKRIYSTHPYSESPFNLHLLTVAVLQNVLKTEH